MIAIKKQIHIPASRHIELDLPKDTPEGVAEVIVLCQRSASAPPRPPPEAVLEPGFTDMTDEEWDAFDNALAEGRKADWFRRDG